MTTPNPALPTSADVEAVRGIMAAIDARWHQVVDPDRPTTDDTERFDDCVVDDVRWLLDTLAAALSTPPPEGTTGGYMCPVCGALGCTFCPPTEGTSDGQATIWYPTAQEVAHSPQWPSGGATEVTP